MNNLIGALIVLGVLALTTYVIVLLLEFSLLGALIVGVASHRGWAELERYVVRRQGK